MEKLKTLSLSQFLTAGGALLILVAFSLLTWLNFDTGAFEDKTGLDILNSGASTVVFKSVDGKTYGDIGGPTTAANADGTGVYGTVDGVEIIEVINNTTGETLAIRAISSGGYKLYRIEELGLLGYIAVQMIPLTALGTLILLGCQIVMPDMEELFKRAQQISVLTGIVGFVFFVIVAAEIGVTGIGAWISFITLIGLLYFLSRYRKV